MQRSTARRAALAALLGLAVAAPTAGAGGVAKPRSGTTYTGSPGKVELLTGASGLDLVAFTIRCGRTTARTVLNDVALRRTARGYAFSLRSGAGFTYGDDDNGANGSVTVSGRFSTTARTARGTVRATVKRCGTQRLTWTATRRN